MHGIGVVSHTVSSVPHVKGMGMSRESISKRKNGKAEGLSDLGLEMVKSPVVVGTDIITDLVNQIKVVVTPAEWELGTIVNCYSEKRSPLERAKYKELKLTDHFLKIVVRDVWKLIRQQVDISEMQFGFSPGQELKTPFFFLETLTGELLSKKEESVLYIWGLEESC